MKKMILKHYSLIFSVVGILVLYFLLRTSQSTMISINEISKYEGKQVTIEGTVLEHHLTKYGSQIIEIENDNATTTVFIEGKIEIEFGDKIQVTGEIQKYEGEWEIVVNSINMVKIIEKWKNSSFPLWQLAENPSKYLGLNINVSGYIDYISNSYFYLSDFDRKYSLPVFYTLVENLTISPGLKISVYGQFLFDEENFRYKLELNQKIHRIKIQEE
jgi:DNA/RNA endonuclease YhcR with UshA esterase domain